MNILVMGGTEFISRAVAKHLIQKEHIVDIFTRGLRAVDYSGYRNHFKGDRKSLEALKVLSKEKYDYVFDISAYTREDVEKLTSTLNKNDIKRYVFCSSGAVYTESEETLNEEYPRGENKNWGDYGLNKKFAEDYLIELYKKEGFPITIFRPIYIYGEENNIFREGYFFERILKGLPIPLPKSEVETQFIHIEDLVNTFESAMYTDKAIGEAYNIAHEERVTWGKLIQTTMEVCNKKVEAIEVDEEKAGEDVKGYFPFRDINYVTSIDKLKSNGLYEPKIGLKEGLIRAYSWYREVKPEFKMAEQRMAKADKALELMR